MNIAIVGCRWFTDYQDLNYHVNQIIEFHEPDNVKIISGGAFGVDQLAELYAKKHNYEFVCYEADWEKYGKKAGYLRNQKIVQNSDLIVAFWDYESKGIKLTIDLAKQYNKKYCIFDIRGW